MKERRELREAQERERRMKKKRSRDSNNYDEGCINTSTSTDNGASASPNATNTFHNSNMMSWGNSNGMTSSSSTFQRSIRYKSSEYDDNNNEGSGGDMIGSYSFHHRLRLANPNANEHK